MISLPDRQLQPIENLLTDSWDIQLWKNTKINGYPMFASVRMMNQSDWERARKAIHRELEHRKNMEI